MESHDENAKRKIDLENEIKKLREDNQKRKDEVQHMHLLCCNSECMHKLERVIDLLNLLLLTAWKRVPDSGRAVENL
jgi:hypothetical protein